MTSGRVTNFPIFLLVSALLVPVAARAADPFQGADLQRFVPAVDPLGAFSAGSGQILGDGGWAVGVHLNYARNPLVLRQNGTRLAETLSDVGALQLHGAFRLLSFLELGFGLPIVAYTAGNDTRAPALPQQSLGDLEVQPRFRVLSQEDFGVSLALTPAFTIPLGGAAALAGDPTVTVTPRASVSHVFRHAFVTGDLWFHGRPKTTVLPWMQTGSELGLRVAGGLDVAERTELLLEFDGALGVAGTGNPLEVLLGARHHVSDEWVVEAGVGTGVHAAPGTPDWRVIAGVTYGRRLRRGLQCVKETPDGPQHLDGAGADHDEDGLDDACDVCPLEPEVMNGYKDGDGCPESDRDGDGVFDDTDRCVDVPGRPSDGCPDQDGDGLLDDQDTCPALASPAPTGCPDKDGDGLYDPNDRCIDVPEDKDGFEDSDGCPDLDDDQDGIPDASDTCARVPEDKDGFEDTDGCPDPDNDQDGVLDGADKCPDQKETINGVDDGDGCPDKGKTLVVVKKDRIEILDKVYFATDKDIIEERSFGLLRQVALSIKAHPEIEKIRVEGHTDDQGGYEHNVDLSQRRAAAVVRFMVGEGLAPERFVARGYASDRPIASNKTDKGRATNRRVEFHIVDPDAPEETTAPAPATPASAAPATPATPAKPTTPAPAPR